MFNEKKRFVLQYKQYSSYGVIRIILDTETGINYMTMTGGGMTPLLDKHEKIITS